MSGLPDYCHSTPQAFDARSSCLAFQSLVYHSFSYFPVLYLGLIHPFLYHSLCFHDSRTASLGTPVYC